MSGGLPAPTPAPVTPIGMANLEEERMAEKSEQVVNGQNAKSLSEEQIVTERTLSRRSFLTSTGALLAGAVALATGMPLMAQEKDSDADKKKTKASTKKSMKKGSDPDKKKTMTKKSAKTKKKAKASDPDSHRL